MILLVTFSDFTKISYNHLFQSWNVFLYIHCYHDDIMYISIVIINAYVYVSQNSETLHSITM